MLFVTDDFEDSNNTLCLLQSYFINASQLSSIMYPLFIKRWTAIIAFILYQSCVNNQKEEALSLYGYLFFGFCIPFSISIYPFFTHDYGLAGISCWIKEDNIDNSYRSTIIRYINFYIPLIVIILYNSIIYIIIICKLYGISEQQTKFIYKMISYPLILIICWIFTAFNRTYEEISQQQQIWLLYLSKALSGLMGFFNYIGYGFTPQVRESFTRYCFTNKSNTLSVELALNQQQNLNLSQNTQEAQSRNSVDSQRDSIQGDLSFIAELY
ncbi:unnamed protein product [Paramecium sonneborni]|uniref:G-protein coupled receptors family 2 profile 2 domain-containing protein n=1 Tax=Paramecium sonneborni TaxID=65129 RepID=A0A8S1PPN6_9CILI|nr:unnamed protein product [Paramecium sonneborni]